jgi:molybdate transport system ATP-binding protein
VSEATTAETLAIDVAVSAGALEIVARLDVGARGLVLVGPNGAGKTTTLLAVLGLTTPLRGRVVIGGQALFDAERGLDLAPEQRRLGYMPQDYALFPHPSAADNVGFALACGERPAAVAERRARARELLADVGVAEAADKRPDTLSGGERQRVALARALAVAPRALLLDEPFAALDVETRADVRAFMAERLRLLARPFLVVTHDLADAAALAAPVAVMEGGRIVQRGEIDELARSPATAYVARLTATSPDR